jgi:hypothetical protein
MLSMRVHGPFGSALDAISSGKPNFFGKLSFSGSVERSFL